MWREFGVSANDSAGSASADSRTEKGLGQVLQQGSISRGQQEGSVALWARDKFGSPFRITITNK